MTTFIRRAALATLTLAALSALVLSPLTASARRNPARHRYAPAAETSCTVNTDAFFAIYPSRRADAAARAAGGCVAIGGVIPAPAGANGPDVEDFHSRFTSRNDATWLVLPGPDDGRALVYAGRGLSRATLVHIARTTLPRLDEDQPECSGGCG